MKAVCFFVIAIFTTSLSAQDRTVVLRQIQTMAMVNANLRLTGDNLIVEDYWTLRPEGALAIREPLWKIATVYKKPYLVTGSVLHLIFEKRIISIGTFRSRLQGLSLSVAIYPR